MLTSSGQAEADTANLRDDLLLLHRHGERGRTARPLRKTEVPRRVGQIPPIGSASLHVCACGPRDATRPHLDPLPDNASPQPPLVRNTTNHSSLLTVKSRAEQYWECPLCLPHGDPVLRGMPFHRLLLLSLKHIAGKSPLLTDLQPVNRKIESNQKTVTISSSSGSSTVSPFLVMNQSKSAWPNSMSTAFWSLVNVLD